MVPLMGFLGPEANAVRYRAGRHDLQEDAGLMEPGEQCPHCGNDFDPHHPCGCGRSRVTKEECEEQGGHVFEMNGPPPWKCTFCGYAPETAK